MSPALNLRYPEGVRVGSTSPSASRKRIFEIVTSGNSSRSVVSTVPMLTSRPAGPTDPAVPFFGAPPVVVRSMGPSLTGQMPRRLA